MGCTGNFDCDTTHFCDPHTSICHSCNILCESDRDSAEECRLLCPLWKQQSNIEEIATPETAPKQQITFYLLSLSVVLLVSFVCVCVPFIVYLVRIKHCNNGNKQKKAKEISDQRNHSDTIKKEILIGCAKEKDLLLDRQSNSVVYKPRDEVEIGRDTASQIEEEILIGVQDVQHSTKDSHSMLYNPSVSSMVQASGEGSSEKCVTDKYYCIKEEHEDEFTAREETNQNQLALPLYSEITIPKRSWNENAEKDVQSVEIYVQHDENMLMAISSIRPRPYLNGIESASDSESNGSVYDGVLSLHSNNTFKGSTSSKLNLQLDQESAIMNTQRQIPGGNNRDNNRCVFDQLIEGYDLLSKRMPELPFVKGLMIGNDQLDVLVTNSCDLTEIHHQIMNIMPSTIDPHIIRVNKLSECL